MRMIQRDTFVLETTDIENLAKELGWQIVSHDDIDGIAVKNDKLLLEYHGYNGFGDLYAFNDKGGMDYIGKINGACDTSELLNQINEIIE